MSDWKFQVDKHLTDQNQMIVDQNLMLAKMTTKVDLMWKAFIGVCAFAGLAILGRIFNVI